MSRELGALMTDWRALDAEWQRLRRIEIAARAMFAQEEGVCVECGWVGDHAATHADAFARACLTLPLRAALSSGTPPAAANRRAS